MSKWLYDFSLDVATRMEVLMRSAVGLADLRRIQAVYFRAKYGDTAQEVADRTGLKLQTVRNIHSAWRKGGEASLAIKPKGGRYREAISLAEESKLLDRHKKKAEAGGILEVSKIHLAHEEAAGKSLAKSTTYRMLDRHGWRKISPRPKHPKSDQEAKEAFKKTGQKSLQSHKKKLPS